MYRGVDMIAAVTGPIVKIATPMCTHKIARSVKDMAAILVPPGIGGATGIPRTAYRESFTGNPSLGIDGRALVPQGVPRGHREYRSDQDAAHGAQRMMTGPGTVDEGGKRVVRHESDHHARGDEDQRHDREDARQHGPPRRHRQAF